MSKIALNHLALVVDDIETALGFWRDQLGIVQAGATQALPEEAARVAFLELEGGSIELIQPTDEDSGVAKYLAKRGPGMHHLCLEVEDLDATLRQLKAAGCELVNEEARHRGAWRYAFIHPRSAGGVLLELYERAETG